MWRCAAREEEDTVVVDITWDDGHSAVGLPIDELLPRAPFSRALVQVKTLMTLCCLCGSEKSSMTTQAVRDLQFQ